MRLWEFGKGLAIGADDVIQVWAILHDILTRMPENARNITVLGGFLAGAAECDFDAAVGVLETLCDDPILAHRLPWLQSQVALDEIGIQRLGDAIDAGKIRARDFNSLASGLVRDAPASQLAPLLIKIAAMRDGSMVALDILHMHLHCLRDDSHEIEPALISCGRYLLGNADFAKHGRSSDFGLKTVVEVCLSGPSGVADTRLLCRRIRAALDEYRLSAYEICYLLEGLFEVQPSTALDELVMAEGAGKNRDIFEAWFNRPTPVDKIELATMRFWADFDPSNRYPALGNALTLFATNEAAEETGLSPRFLEMLEFAPDRMTFLNRAGNQIRPSGWCGPLHLVLERRHMMLKRLSSHPDPVVRIWVADQEPWLASLISADQKRESEGEQSFE